MEGIFDILLLSFAIYVSGVFVPTMAALYWEKATRTGAIASGIAATLVVVALYALDKPFGVEPIMVSLVVSAVLMTVISWVTYRPEQATPKLFC
jgi:Na+/pantothenate symporter